MTAYASQSDFIVHGLPSAVVDDINDSEVIAAVLETASSQVDEALRTVGYGVPIPTESVTPAIVKRVCELAAYSLMVTHGFDPREYDEQLRRRYEDALQWLADIRDRRLIILDMTEDATPATAEGAPLIGDALIETEW